MNRKNITSLNQSGFDHIFVMLAVVVLVSIVGTSLLVLTKAASEYRNPLRSASYRVGRIDEGVDYSGSGPVYAIGPGVVEGSSTHAGWPTGNFTRYRLSSGSHKDKYVYVAEDCSPLVHNGQRVSSSTELCRMYNGGSGIEMGWAAPPSRGYLSAAAISSDPYRGSPTQSGKDFNNFAASLGTKKAR